MGYPADKQIYLQEGDVVTIEIEKLGSLTSRMVARKRASASPSNQSTQH